MQHLDHRCKLQQPSAKILRLSIGRLSRRLAFRYPPRDEISTTKKTSSTNVSDSYMHVKIAGIQNDFAYPKTNSNVSNFTVTPKCQITFASLPARDTRASRLCRAEAPAAAAAARRRQPGLLGARGARGAGRVWGAEFAFRLDETKI